MAKLNHLRMLRLVLPSKEARNLQVRAQCSVELVNQLLHSILVVLQVLNQTTNHFRSEAVNRKLKKSLSVLEALLLKTLVAHLQCSHLNNRQSRRVPLHSTLVVVARSPRLRQTCLVETRTLKVLDLTSEVTTRAPLLLEEICSVTPVLVQHPLQPSTLEVLVLRTLLKAQASILEGTQASLHRLVICLAPALNLLVIMVSQHLAGKLSVPVETNVKSYKISFAFD